MTRKICLILKKNKKHNKKVISFLKKFTKFKIDVFYAKINTKPPRILERKKYDFILGNSSSGLLEAPYLKKTIEKVNLCLNNDKKNFELNDLKKCYGDGRAANKMKSVLENLPLNFDKKKIFYDLWKNI